MRLIPLLAPPLFLTIACQSGAREGRESSGLTGVTSAGEDPGGDSGQGDDGPGTGTGDSGGSGASESGDPLFDVGSPDTDGGPGDDPADESCQKVDLLFVIDDSGSMGDNQTELVNSFPEFIDGIETQLAGVESYHIGVVTTDAYRHNRPGCLNPGDLVTQTGGDGSSNAVCGPYVSGSYMGEADDLLQTFSCAAQVGTQGDGDEKPIDSIRGALAPANQVAGACNEGFLRDDALLVIVVITDEDDLGGDPVPFLPPQGSMGSPTEWFPEIAALKGGVETNVVFLSLVGNTNVPNECADGQAYNAKQLIELTGLFTNGFLGDVCASSYAPFFEQAVSVVDGACNDFTPPG